jgi:hypothetical protein
MAMEVKTKFIIKSLLGFIIGLFVGLFFWFLNGQTDYGVAFILHFVMSGILGLLAMGGSVVYDIESWGLLKATVSHYVLVIFDYTVVAVLLKWYTRISDFLISIVIMTVLYAMIWLFESLMWKKTIGEMNAELKKMQER